MAKKYVDDKIEYFDSDVEKIARKPLMYISYSGSKGALHLAKEVINNGIDEAINKRSPANTVNIFFDEKTNMITVYDDGRGISFNAVELVCTKIQAGSKMDRDASVEGVDNKAFSSGENGLGLTAVNAISDMLTIVVYREGQKGTFVFKRGFLESKTIVKQVKGDSAHGTRVSFIPSEKILGKCQISLEELINWVTDISYLIDSGITITLSYCKKKSDVVKTIEFKHQDGVKDMLEAFCKKQLMEPVYINFKGSYRIEENGDVTFSEKESLGDDIIIQTAFTLNPDVHNDDDTHYKSFCNFVTTVNHGVHLNACKTAWCHLITKLANESMSESEAKKGQVNFEDCRGGLFATVNIMCVDPQFASQTKEKISNDELFKPIRKIVYVHLLKYFKENPGVLKKVIKFVKTNAKSRLEIGKIRKSEYKPMDNLSEHVLGCFTPANGDGYRELFIVEGKSAKGSMENARDARTQALFALRGVPKNSFGLKLSELLANQEFKHLVKCLGCGIGADFNMDKLKYDKIIIFTDSDIDGFRIASLMSTFFMIQYPDIVKAGKLYKAVAPLYLIEDPKHPYILNKIEYYRYFADKLVKIVKVKNHKGVELSNNQLKELVIYNNQYLSYLDALINYYSVNPDIIEFIVEYKDDRLTDAQFNKLLKKRFPEMVYEDDVVKGVYEGSYQYINIDKTFYIRSKNLHDLIIHNGINDFSFIDGKHEENHVTFGRFLRYAKRYVPVTKSRLKGLGEMNASDLWNSSLNPVTRELIQLTSDNIGRDLERFQTLHGKKDSDARKELMKEYILDINDIDN